MSEIRSESRKQVPRAFFDCIVCDKHCRPATGDGEYTSITAPNGTVFEATGNYGSTLFDPAPAEPQDRLEIVICDDCLRAAAKRGCVREDLKDGTIRPFATPRATGWEE